MNLEELSFLIIVVILVAFYFIFIRPSTQEQKRQQQTIRDLRAGDEVITTAGFYAVVKEIRTPEQGDIQVVLDLGNGFEVRALTSSILKRVSSAADAVEQKDEAKA